MGRKSTRKTAPRLTRDQSLDAYPVATEVLRRRPLPDGGERVTVPFHPTTMQRWFLRVPTTATQEYELDAMGVEVLGLCDGKSSVRQVAAQFAKTHKVSPQEAEHAVVAFLQTMVTKGLAVVAVERNC